MRNRPLAAACRAWLLATLTGVAAGCRSMIVLGSECDGGAQRCLPADEPEHDGSLPVEASEPSVDATPACPDASCSCLPPLPLARWSLDEQEGSTSHEQSGLAPAGALVNFAEQPWIEGYAGGALQFDGNDDFVQVGEVGAIRTLSFWIKPESTHVSTSQTAVLLPTAYGPRNDWNMPELAYADDDDVAMAGTWFVDALAQHWGGFHLAEQLPMAAEILGITVTVDTANLGLLGFFSVELSWNGGVGHTDARYGWGQLIAGSNLRQAGGPDRLWGRTWTAADFRDENFAVRASFGGVTSSMDIDYLAVQVDYAEHSTPRAIVSLSESTGIEFGADPATLALINWPEARIYVNGSQDAPLTPGDWNHVVVTSNLAQSASDLRIGAVRSPFLTFPFHGSLDELLLFEAELAPDTITTPYVAPSSCAEAPAP